MPGVDMDATNFLPDQASTKRKHLVGGLVVVSLVEHLLSISIFCGAITLWLFYLISSQAAVRGQAACPGIPTRSPGPG